MLNLVNRHSNQNLELGKYNSCALSIQLWNFVTDEGIREKRFELVFALWLALEEFCGET